MTSGPRNLKPCGTTAAFARHRYNGEDPCADCRAAEKRAEAERSRRRRRSWTAGRIREDEIRDPVVPYRWRARRYAWAVRVLEASEARYGVPEEGAA